MSSILIECQVLHQANHPFICHMDYFYQTARRLFFVMPMVQGGELKRLIKSKPVPEEQIKMWAAQLLLALKYCYESDILHRDLKPDNILIDEHGSIQLIDFGLSRALTKGELATTQCGSPQYMAPEHFNVIQGRKGHSYEADYWSVGIILYEMLAGTVPFPNNQSQEAVSKLIFPAQRTAPSSQLFREFIKELLQYNP